MARMAMTVYITQDATGRSFLPALKFGKLEMIMPANAQVVITAVPAIRKLKRELAGFNDNDYLLLSGDPLIMGVAVMVACSVNMGRAKLLKWDKREKLYYEVQVDMHEKGEEYGG